MSYQIEIIPAALDELKALPSHVRPQARQVIDALAQEPRPPRARELRGKPGIYRIWLAGHWRIAYEIDDDARIILIRRIRRKEQIGYESL